MSELGAIALAAAIGLGAALALNGCCTAPVRAEATPCRLDAPPELVIPLEIRPGTRGCPALPPKAERGPETIALCFDAQGAADLNDLIGKLDTYSRDAWRRCGDAK